MISVFCFYGTGHHRDLHVLTHSFPTRRSSDLRHLEPGREGIRGAHTTAPPEKLKNDRKKHEAANAIVRPNTIWISLRNPPDVSPKASARPVAMMMMTATMRATGPWMDSRMD